MAAAVQLELVRGDASTAPSAQLVAAFSQLRSSDKDEANDGLNAVIAASRSGNRSIHAFNELEELVNSPGSILRFKPEIPEHRQAYQNFAVAMLERAAGALFESPIDQHRATALRFHCNNLSSAVETPIHTRDRMIEELGKTQDPRSICAGIDFMRRYTTIIHDQQYQVTPTLRDDPKTHEAILCGKTAAFIQGIRSRDPAVQSAFLIYADSHRRLFTADEWQLVREFGQSLNTFSTHEGVRKAAGMLLNS